MTLIETGPKIQMTRRCLAVGVLLTLACSASPASESLGQDTQTLTAKEQQTIDRALQTLQQSLKQMRDQNRPRRDLVDAVIFHKGLTWALQYDRQFTPADITLLQTAILRGQQRAQALARNRKPWAMRKGRVALGYVSQVDESVQPYGVIIPNNYDPSRPIRLDVVLHGSTRPVGLSELRFIARFDEGDQQTDSVPDQPFIELHPLGRVENGYRWAGETDVFEAIEDVCRRWTDILWSGSQTVREKMRPDQVRRIYYSILAIYILWTFVCATIFLFYSKPKIMVLIVANLNTIGIGFTAFLILRMNCRLLPVQLRPRWYHRMGMIGCGIFYLGMASIVFFQTQVPLIRELFF